MKWIYRFTVFFARIVIFLGGFLIPKIRHFSAARKNLFQRIAIFRDSNPGELAWFHVASLGEYEQARPVIAELKHVRPELLVAVSFFSPSGFDNVIKKPQPQVDFITYLPLDSKGNAVRFVDLLRPKLVFFVKYDLWYHHIHAIKSVGIPLFLFSASFRPGQPYFRRGGFFRDILFQFDYIFTQNQSSLELLKTINYRTASIAGDTRFDRVAETAKNHKEYPEMTNWVGDRPTAVAGSVWEEDMGLLIPLMNSVSGYRWIIAPHDLNPEAMNRWAEKLTLSVVRYSQWDSDSNPDVIFIDNIGMLSSLYQFARVAYVGGAMGRGLHNILEPLGFGIPVIFGKLKKPVKFPEAAESQLNGCGFEVKDFDSLMRVFKKLEDPHMYEESTKAATKWVKMNEGAADRIINKVEELMLN
ncbi:3-deoxy-D-manno-octulosonic acid transferase [Algoriphagus sp. AGSA1]|uniref:3-deoxy-D-manno-octulosonic acid transferase n=1 Tax=Algoriphagus sp. AGSA1 TaxID=2907213 RepID=UPI001F2199DA|nr:glycosyltransferase N-terminal domain-containing protein [Algoriphagus sp. AGSA1]MCE7054088.1 3-deoxy-D-manno-octulosonic acid transferase [Algoriphagus sp. AGSA1]